ncbi:MAG TPA: YafY family protein [Acidimicrobiales bacterium]|nr:YafY family protein [Acidimicrobiales bacterium]
MVDTSARLLRLLSLLQSQPGGTGPELADRLGVTPRTIRRDVDRLRQLGYPVEAVTGAEGGYRLRPGASLPPLLLDDEEAVAVSVGLRAAAGTAIDGVAAAATAALGKVERVLPARLRPQVEAVAAATVPLAGGRGDIGADALVTVARACRGAERLRFDYEDRQGRRSERTVEPYRLVYTGQRWYLVARDVRADGWRTFRLDRIEQPVATGHGFVLEDPPDAAALVARAVSVAPYRYQARVVVHAPPDEVARLVPPTVATIEALDTPDRCLLVTGGDDLDAIAAHLLLLGRDFRVLEPPELRERLVTLAGRLAEASGG